MLNAAAEQPAGKLASIAIATNGPGEVALDGVFSDSGGKGLGVRFELAMGQPFVKTEPARRDDGVDGSRRRAASSCCPISSPTTSSSTPPSCPWATAELPSENFLLHLLPERDAIVMTVASNRTRDARIELARQRPGNAGQIDRSQMFYGAGGKIWVAVLQDANIWHACDVGKEPGGQGNRPGLEGAFAAQWRVDWRLANKLTRQLGNALATPERPLHEARLVRQSDILPPDRKHWTTVLGSFQFPCWIDRDAPRLAAAVVRRPTISRGRR